jgi:hypothetical protein
MVSYCSAAGIERAAESDIERVYRSIVGGDA